MSNENSLANHYQRWSEAELAHLRAHYSNGNLETLSRHLGRTVSTIRNKASALGLVRVVDKADLKPLLARSQISCYWMGYLLADGHFTLDGDRLCVTAAAKDEGHIAKFADFIAARVRVTCNGTQRTVTARSKELLPELRSFWQLSNRKTYEPPSMSRYSISLDEFLSLIVGFIDGDGLIHLRRDGDCYGRIKCHASWLANLRFMRDVLVDRFELQAAQKPFLNKTGFAEWTITHRMLRGLKRHVDQFDLPVMERKWIKVKEKKTVLTEELVHFIRQSPKSSSQLARELGVVVSTVSNVKARRSWKHL